MKQSDLKQLFTTLDAKKEEFSSLVGVAKGTLKDSGMSEEDKTFFEDAINQAMQGKDLSIELVNKRVKAIVDAEQKPSFLERVKAFFKNIIRQQKRIANAD